MDKKNSNDKSIKSTEAPSGNASNPSPHNTKMEPANNDQLLNEKAEKYLREGGNIEDYPDAEDEKDAEKIERETNN